MLRRMMFAGLYNVTVPSVTGQTVKINLCDSGTAISDTTWNNKFTGSSSGLLDITGATTPWVFTEVTSGHDTDVAGNSSFVDADFPLQTINSNWNRFGSLSVKVSGLNIAKTYTVKIMSYYGGGVGNNRITVNTQVSANFNPTQNPTKLTFTGVAPNASGEIIVLNDVPPAGGDYVVTSAFIITEN